MTSSTTARMPPQGGITPRGYSVAASSTNLLEIQYGRFPSPPPARRRLANPRASTAGVSPTYRPDINSIPPAPCESPSPSPSRRRTAVRSESATVAGRVPRDRSIAIDVVAALPERSRFSAGRRRRPSATPFTPALLTPGRCGSLAGLALAFPFLREIVNVLLPRSTRESRSKLRLYF